MKVDEIFTAKAAIPPSTNITLSSAAQALLDDIDSDLEYEDFNVEVFEETEHAQQFVEPALSLSATALSLLEDIENNLFASTEL